MNRWRIVVELTLDIDPEKDVERYPGDTEKDIAGRVLMERAKPILNRIQGKGPHNFQHYHILEHPKKVFDA